MNPHHELIRLAAEMVRGIGLPPEFPEDRGFCKSTPIKERQRIVKEAELARETAKVWGLRVRAAADLLASDKSTVSNK